MKTRPTLLAAAESRIAALISPELEARALKELEDCLGAEVFVRSARGENGIEYRAVPDRALRLAAAVKIIEFSRGRPGTSLTLAQPPGSGQPRPTRASLVEVLAAHPELVQAVIDGAVLNARQVGRSGPASTQ